MIFLTACSSLSTSTFSEKKYVGKLSLSQNNKVSNFTVRIVVFYEDLIIQVSKPFLGNLIKIKFNPYEGFSSYSETINLDLSVFKNVNKAINYRENDTGDGTLIKIFKNLEEAKEFASKKEIILNEDKLQNAKKACKALGFSVGTEEFAECSLKKFKE